MFIELTTNTGNIVINRTHIVCFVATPQGTQLIIITGATYHVIQSYDEVIDLFKVALAFIPRAKTKANGS